MNVMYLLAARYLACGGYDGEMMGLVDGDSDFG